MHACRLGVGASGLRTRASVLGAQVRGLGVNACLVVVHASRVGRCIEVHAGRVDGYVAVVVDFEHKKASVEYTWSSKA